MSQLARRRVQRHHKLLGDLTMKRTTLCCSLLLMLAGALYAQKDIKAVPREVVRNERPKRWAVLIGVDKYDDEAGIGSLKCCAADMKLLYRVLTGPCGGFAPENVLLMTADAADPGHTPTFSHIVTMIPRWLRDVQPNDDVLIAFSGHGMNEGDRAYLLPSTAMRGNLRLTAVPVQFVREKLEACKARRKILIIDACHAGAGKDVAAAEKGFLEDVCRGKGFLRLASCGPKQKSNEDPKLKSAVGKGHGVFTYYLAQGIEGRADRDRDGRVDADEAYRYAYSRTRDWARRKGLEQDPLKSGKVTGVMTISYLRTPEQLRKDQESARRRIRALERRAAATGADAARKDIEAARRREMKQLRELEKRLAELGSSDDTNALQNFRDACRRVAELQKELARQQTQYRESAPVVRELRAKLDAALAGRGSYALAALRHANAQLVRQEARRAEMAKEMLAEHPRMREIDGQIGAAARDLGELLKSVLDAEAVKPSQANVVLSPAARVRLPRSVSLRLVLELRVEREMTRGRSLLSISSNPSGACVYVNGKDTRKRTPCVIPAERNTQYTVTLRKENDRPGPGLYKPVTLHVTTALGGPARVRATLEWSGDPKVIAFQEAIQAARRALDRMR